MVSEISRRGLIISPARRTSDLLEELVAYFDWPVLLQPSVRLLLQQLEVSAPHCLLFWLDDTYDVAHTLQLISRLRDRGPRPYRIAIAHRLQPDMEPTIRAAGVHSLLCTSGNITALVEGALLPLLHGQQQPAHANHGTLHHAAPLIRAPTSGRTSPAKMHPP